MGSVALAERPRQFFSFRRRLASLVFISGDVWHGRAGFFPDDVWLSPAWPGCSPCQEGPRMAQILRVWLVIEQLICQLERGRATLEPDVA